jgi:hypothetical protein
MEDEISKMMRGYLNTFYAETSQFLNLESIQGIVELLSTIGTDSTSSSEIYEILMIQIPEIFHYKISISFIDNIFSLFSNGNSEIFKNISVQNQILINKIRETLLSEALRLEYCKEHNEAIILDIDEINEEFSNKISLK